MRTGQKSLFPLIVVLSQTRAHVRGGILDGRFGLVLLRPDCLGRLVNQMQKVDVSGDTSVHLLCVHFPLLRSSLTQRSHLHWSAFFFLALIVRFFFPAAYIVEMLLIFNHLNTILRVFPPNTSTSVLLSQTSDLCFNLFIVKKNSFLQSLP